MPRVVISRNTLDQLIRAKMDVLDECRRAQPLPVQRCSRNGDGGCNWTLPGFVGDETVIRRCRLGMQRYLDLLRSEFDVAEDA